MQQEGNQLQIVLTTGLRDPERAAFALNTALVAASAGCTVTVFLAMQAPEWACAQRPGGSEIQEVYSILDSAAEAGVQLEACSACFEKFCAGDRAPALRDGFRLAGMLTFVQRALGGVETISF